MKLRFSWQDIGSLKIEVRGNSLSILRYKPAGSFVLKNLLRHVVLSATPTDSADIKSHTDDDYMAHA